VAAATAILFAASFSANATNGYFGHGYGTANKGLAGGGVALPQDAMIAATNPAGMVMVGDRIDAGAALFSPSDRGYEAGSSGAGGNCNPLTGQCPFTIGGPNGGQSITSSNDFFVIPHFAYNKMLSTDSSIGVSVYGNGGMNTLYKGGQASLNNGMGSSVTLPGTFGAGDAGIDLVQLFVTTTYARKINANASWGASLIVAGQRFRAKGLSPSFSGFSSDPANLSANKHDYSYGVGGKFGIMGEVTPGVTLAASYQTKISMGEFDDYAGLFAENGDFDIPPTATVGLAWETAPNSVLTFDVQYIWYGDIAAIANPIQNLFSSCTPGPTGGTGPNCLGGSNGAGFGWEDMTIFKVGYQWQSSPEWTWRVGYSYGENPIPDDQTMFNILAPAVVESAITFGFTKKMGPTNDLSLAFMYAPNTDVTGANPFDPTQQIKIEMEQYEVEASWAWKF